MAKTHVVGLRDSLVCVQYSIVNPYLLVEAAADAGPINYL